MVGEEEGRYYDLTNSVSSSFGIACFILSGSIIVGSPVNGVFDVFAQHFSVYVFVLLSASHFFISPIFPRCSFYPVPSHFHPDFVPFHPSRGQTAPTGYATACIADAVVDI